MQHRWWVGAALAALLCLTGCNNSGHNQNSTDARFLNAVVDAEPLDFLVADDVKAAGLSLGSASDYSEFTAGSRDLKVRSATNGSVLFEKSIQFGNGVDSTFIVYGKRAAVQTLQLLDDTTKPSSGHFKVRAVGLAGDSTPVDLYFAPGGDISGEAPAISGIAVGGATDYTEVTAGSFQVILALTGTKDIVFQSSARSFAEGTQLTVVILPASGSGKLLNVTLLTPPGNASAAFLANASSRVKAVNAVPDSTSLNLKVNGVTLLTGIPFAAASGYVNAASGSRTLQVEDSAVPGATLASLTRTLDPAKDYTLMAVSPRAQAQLVALSDDNSIPAAGTARVRFVNTLVGSATVDVLVNFAGLASGIAFASASSYYALAARNDYTVTFATAGGVTALTTATPVEFVSGSVYTYYLFGTPSAPQMRLVRDRS